MAAPNLPTLVPTSYDSQTGTTWTTTTVGNIDNTVASPDGAFIVAGADSISSIFYAFSDMPSDFAKIKTLAYNIRYKIESLAGDTVVLYFVVLAANKTTAYTNEATVVSTTANIALTNKGSTALTVTLTGLNATKANWDGAFLRIRTAHTANMGNDGSVWSIDEVEMTGTYDGPPTTVLGDPADAATGQSLTPTLNFTGTDPNADEVEYQLEVDTVNTFDSQAVGFDLKYIDLWMSKVNSPTDNLFVEIRDGSSPTGSLLGTSDNVSGSTLTTTIAPIRFTFATTVSLTPEATYTWVIRRQTYDVSNVYQVAFTQDSSYPYDSFRDNSSSGVWGSANTTDDFLFVVSSASRQVIAKNSRTYSNYWVFYGEAANTTTHRLAQTFLAPLTLPLIRVLSINNVPDGGFPAQGITDYYFDSSDAAPSDPDSAWGSDSEAFNGEENNGAYSTTYSDTTYGYLLGEGTTAPTTNSTTITWVAASIATFDDGDQSVWSDNVSLSIPTGGWTWAKLAALEVKLTWISAQPRAHIYTDGLGELLGTVDGFAIISNTTICMVDLHVTHGYGSGTEQTFTIQAGNTLTASTEYFWRVRAIDRKASNIWGAWSSTRSFTTLSGGNSFNLPYAFFL